MDLQNRLTQLLDVLSRETELYEAMSTLMKKEKDAAIQSELNALNEAQIEKENILVALGMLEGQRRDLVATLADTLGHSARNMNLTEIAQIVGEPYAARLMLARLGLSAVLKTVQEANQRNRQLFEHSRDLIRGSINLLSELGSTNPIYYRTGAIQSTGASGKCVCDEI